MRSTHSPEIDLVRQMWSCADQRDWTGMLPLFADDSIYYDVPTGPQLAARGPADIVDRLRAGLESLASYSNHPGVAVSDGEHVSYEHSETWVWETGEQVTLPFVSIHTVRDGRIILWRDYWDFGTLMQAAPQEWLQKLATRETPWLFDATGLV